MSLLNKLFKTKDKQQAALPVVTREAPKVAAAAERTLARGDDVPPLSSGYE